MKINRKWSAAAAGLLAVTLVGAATPSAFAAPGDPIKNPQSNGSQGSFYLFDENAELAETAGKVFSRAQFVFATSDHDDVNAEIDPDDYATAGTWDTVYKFIAKPNELNGGTGSWRAYALDAAAGPNGGVLQSNLTLGDLTGANNGGIDSVFAADGDWLVGLAFTTNAGVTPVGMVYRTVTVDGDNDTYTVAPIEYEEVVGPQPPTEAELTAGLQDSALVTETVDSKTLAISAGASRAGQTLTVGSYPAGLTGSVVLDGAGNGTINAASIPVNQPTKLWLSNSDYSNIVWDSFTLTESQVRTDTTDLSVDVTASGKFAIIAPASQSIDLGDVRRNQTSAPVALGAVTVFDDRDVLAGWNLNINSTAFTGPNSSSIAATALGYAATGTALPAGITAGAAKLAGEGAFGVLAEGAVNSATGEFDGAVINTDLTFKAPVNAAKGTHTATLTLDLVSK